MSLQQELTAQRAALLPNGDTLVNFKQAISDVHNLELDTVTNTTSDNDDIYAAFAYEGSDIDITGLNIADDGGYGF
tara:strand:+ start:3986 stop:4213 length:228 start_codon:yes stop_codon:yes gene_type:complete